MFVESMVRLGANKMLTELELDEEAAERVMRGIVDVLCGEWGGQQVYFPKNLYSSLSRRDREIAAKFNGANADDLAQDYGISARQIYCIVESERERRMVERRSEAKATHDWTPDGRRVIA